jgi:tight adherence protein B
VVTLVVFAAVGVSMAVFALFTGLGRIIEAREPTIKDRLDILVAVPSMEDVDSSAPVRSRGLGGVISRLRRTVSGWALGSGAATELARADVPLTVSEYAVLSAASALAPFVIALLLSRLIPLACIAALIGSRLPVVYLRRRQRKRRQAFQDQLVDVLQLMVSTLRSGYGITAAMDAVAKQMPPPASDEFARVVHEVGLGTPRPQALANMERRVQSDDLELIVTAININAEVGGNLSTILDSISNTIRERVRIKRELRSLTTQPRLTRSLLTGLPVVLAIAIYVINPEYMGALFQPGPTLLIPLGSVVLVAAGWVVMGRLSHIEI